MSFTDFRGDEQSNIEYLNAHVTIPESLRRQFDSLTRMTRWAMAERLAVELALRSDDQAEIVCHVLDVLRSALAAVAPDEPPIIEYRGPEIGRLVVARLTVDQCLVVADYFGWSKNRIPRDTTLRTLDQTVHDMLGQRIGDKVNKALVRWEKNGWLYRGAR